MRLSKLQITCPDGNFIEIDWLKDIIIYMLQDFYQEVMGTSAIIFRQGRQKCIQIVWENSLMVILLKE